MAIRNQVLRPARVARAHRCNLFLGIPHPHEMKDGTVIDATGCNEAPVACQSHLTAFMSGLVLESWSYMGSFNAPQNQLRHIDAFLDLSYFHSDSEGQNLNLRVLKFAMHCPAPGSSPKGAI